MEYREFLVEVKRLVQRSSGEWECEYSIIGKPSPIGAREELAGTKTILGQAANEGAAKEILFQHAKRDIDAIIAIESSARGGE